MTGETAVAAWWPRGKGLGDEQKSRAQNILGGQISWPC